MKHFALSGLSLHFWSHPSDSSVASESDERHHHHLHASQKARAYLVLIGVAIAGLYVALYTTLPLSQKQRVLGMLIAGLLWMGALFAAVWHRQKWARLVLATLMFLSAFVMVLYFPTFVEYGRNGGNYAGAWIAAILGLVHGFSAWVIGGSHAFKRLTSRGFDRS